MWNIFAKALGELRQFVAHTKMCIQMTKTASCSSKLVLSRHVACSIMKNVQLVADCIRHDYASLAENAYPEAYGAFKHSMLLLIFDEELQVSPVKDDWSLETRSEVVVEIPKRVACFIWAISPGDFRVSCMRATSFEHLCMLHVLSGYFGRTFTP